MGPSNFGNRFTGTSSKLAFGQLPNVHAVCQRAAKKKNKSCPKYAPDYQSSNPVLSYIKVSEGFVIIETPILLWQDEICFRSGPETPSEGRLIDIAPFGTPFVQVRTPSSELATLLAMDPFVPADFRARLVPPLLFSSVWFWMFQTTHSFFCCDLARFA